MPEPVTLSVCLVCLIAANLVLGIWNTVRSCQSAEQQKESRQELKGLTGQAITKVGTPKQFLALGELIHQKLETSPELRRGKLCLTYALPCEGRQVRQVLLNCPDSSWFVELEIPATCRSDGGGVGHSSARLVKVLSGTQTSTRQHPSLQNSRVAVEELPTSFTLYTQEPIPKRELERWLG